jgi:hypothetical protein
VRELVGKGGPATEPRAPRRARARSQPARAPGMSRRRSVDDSPARCRRRGSETSPSRDSRRPARAYPSWDAGRPDRHQRQVCAFLSAGLDGDGGSAPAKRGQAQVLWRAVIQHQPDVHGDRVITVAAQTTRQLLYLSVPIHRTARGFLVVPRYPAFVGGADQRSGRHASRGARSRRRCPARRHGVSLDGPSGRPAHEPARRPRSRRGRFATDDAPCGALRPVDHQGRRRSSGRRGHRVVDETASSGRCARRRRRTPPRRVAR